MKTKTQHLISAAAVSGLILAAGSAVFAHGGFGPGWTGPGWTAPSTHGMRRGGDGMHRGMSGMGMMVGPGGMHGFMGGPRSISGDPLAATNARLTNLKQALDITAEQETVWNGFAAASHDQAKLMASHHQVMHGDARGSLSTEEHLNMMQEGAQHMQKLATATRDLYAALTEEQKAIADRWFDPHCGGPHAPL